MQDVQKLLAEDDAQQAFRRFIDYLRLDAGSGEKRVKEMGSLLAAEYDRFSLKPVGEFCQYAKQTLKPPQLEILLAELRPKAERTQHWVKELDGVTRERLAREARREVTIGGGQVKAAAQRGAVLMQRAKNETDRDKLAKYLIEALGGLTRDIERSYEVIRMLVQAGAMRDLGFDWQEAFKAAAERGKRSGFQESDREWTQIFISACVSIREFLPGKREAGEPTEEQLNNFINEITCVVRAGFASGDDEDLLDALNIVKEYCPTDPPQIQSAAGVEPRLFLDLGPRAKSTAVRGLGQLGNLTMLRARILALAQFAGEERAEMFAAIMGGLRHNDFFFYLKTAFRDAKTPRRQEAIADAVSRLANADSAEMIIAELAKCMKRAVDPAEVRRAKMFVTALGRLGRMKGVEAAGRNQIVEQVIACVGEKDLDLSSHTALQLFTAKLEELERPVRAWAARALIRSIFSIGRGENLSANATSPLGFRTPLITGLARLGKEMLPEMLETATPLVTRYGPGYLAFAEAMQKAGDERAVPLLEAMVRTAFLTSDEPAGANILREQIYDPATMQMKDLDRDDVIHTLLYTMDKIGGETGKKTILGIADQVQAGQLLAPGGETASFLLDTKRKHGTIGKRETAIHEPKEEIPDEIVEKAASLAKGGMFSNRQKQIEGLALLGRARRPDTVPIVVSCLQSKDLMIYRSAETALAQFVTPLPSPKEYEQFLLSFFSADKFMKGDALERVMQIIQRNFPKKPPYDELFRKHAELEITDGALLFRLQAAIQIQQTAPSQKEEEEAEAETADESTAETSAAEKGPELRFGTPLTSLDRKRDYMVKRQEWIRGGKKGPPPEPPE